MGIHKVRQRYLAKQSAINANISWVHALQVSVLYVCAVGVLTMMSAEGRISQSTWMWTCIALTLAFLIYIGLWWNDRMRRSRWDFNKYNYEDNKESDTNKCN
jgi:protein-S-isoprenylcysteine O-methyltransferase Ste14